MTTVGEAYDTGYEHGYEQALKDVLGNLEELRIDYGPLRMSSLYNTYDVWDAVRSLNVRTGQGS